MFNRKIRSAEAAKEMRYKMGKFLEIKIMEIFSKVPYR